MQNFYQFHPKLIVRTPALPFQAESISESKIKQICSETWFQEAIYLASPDLYQMSLDWIAGKEIEKKKKQKLLASLTKYYSRMMSRSTPYGLFAGCSQISWGDIDEVVIDTTSETRQTRLDMHFTGALAAELCKISAIKENLTYYPNTSIYQVGQALRYVEYSYTNSQRSYQITSADNSEYLQIVLAKAQAGINYQSLIKLLVNNEICTQESEDYINQVIDAQLLVSELEPSITGPNFFNQIINVVENISSNFK